MPVICIECHNEEMDPNFNCTCKHGSCNIPDGEQTDGEEDGETIIDKPTLPVDPPIINPPIKPEVPSPKPNPPPENDICNPNDPKIIEKSCQKCDILTLNCTKCD